MGRLVRHLYVLKLQRRLHEPQRGARWRAVRFAHYVRRLSSRRCGLQWDGSEQVEYLLIGLVGRLDCVEPGDPQHGELLQRRLHEPQRGAWWHALRVANLLCCISAVGRRLRLRHSDADQRLLFRRVGWVECLEPRHHVHGDLL